MPKASHYDLTDRKALVIGVENPAAAAIARAYAEAGADVAIAVLQPNESVMQARALKAEIEAMGRASHEYVMDVTLGKNVQVTMRQIAKELGGLDIVCSAPDAFLAKPIASISDTELARVLQINFSSHFFAIRSAAGEFRRTPERGGRIVVITSVLGERGLPNTTAYAAAQGAATNLVRAASQELSRENIMVNGIALGWMDWMDDRIDPEDEEAQRAVRFTVMRRQGRAEEVGPLAVYLSSESATRYVTGQIFPVDGGLTQHL